MAAPTVTFAGVSTFAAQDDNAETVAGVTWASGDIILVLGMTEDNGRLLNLPTATGLTFAALTGVPTNTASSCKGYAWKATAASAGSGTITAAHSQTVNQMAAGIAVWVISGATTAGLSNALTLVSTADVLSVTRAGSNSVIAFLAGDWNATADTTVSPSPAGATQRLASTTTGVATFFAFDWPDQGSAGTTSYGLDSATFTTPANFTKVAVEIKGTAGGTDATVTAVVLDGTGDMAAPVVTGGGNATVTAVVLDGTGDVANPVLSAGATKTAVVLDATGDMAGLAATSIEIDAGAIGATGDMAAAVISTGTSATVTGVVLDGTGDVAAPVLHAGSALTGVVLDGTGDVAVPVAHASSTVTGVVLDGTGDLAAAAVSGTSSATVNATPMQATGDLAAANVTGQHSSTVAAAVMDATGDLAAATVTGGSGGTLPPAEDRPTFFVLAGHTTSLALAGHTTSLVLAARPATGLVLTLEHTTFLVAAARTDSLVLAARNASLVAAGHVAGLLLDG